MTRSTPHEPRLARVAAMVADPARSRMLAYLLSGECASASELARAASVTPATASGHLAQLLEARFVLCEPRGRHRYYRLADADVAHALEALAVVAERGDHEQQWASPERAACARRAAATGTWRGGWGSGCPYGQPRRDPRDEIPAYIDPAPVTGGLSEASDIRNDRRRPAWFCPRDETGESRRFGASCTSRPGCEGGSKHRARHCPAVSTADAGLDTGQILASHRAAPGMRGAWEHAPASASWHCTKQGVHPARPGLLCFRRRNDSITDGQGPVRRRRRACHEQGAKRLPPRTGVRNDPKDETDTFRATNARSASAGQDQREREG